jgi:redox-sensitive bicupin YhaK (pirin superfamily)
VTPNNGAAPAGPSKLQIDQDATIYVGALEAGRPVAHAPAAGRRAYLFAISGATTVNGQRLEPGDQARITAETTLALEAAKPAEVILIDLP